MRSIQTERRRSDAAPLGCETSAADPERVARGRQLMLEDDTYAEIAATFRALADGTRAKIVFSLLQQELCTCDVAAIVGVSESVVSQHLRVLRELRLVRSRRSGKLLFHTLDDAHIRLLLSVALSHVRDVDRQHLGLEGMLVSLYPAAETSAERQAAEVAAHGA